MDAETQRWLGGLIALIILGLIGFIATRLYREVDGLRKRSHDQQNGLIKTNAEVSLLKELFVSIFKREK